MSANNPYFDHSTSNKRLIAGDTARAGDVNALFDAVSAGFTAAMGDIALRLPLPAGTQTNIPLTPAARAARALVFGADGHLETWPAIDAATVSQLFAARDDATQQAGIADGHRQAAASSAVQAADQVSLAADQVSLARDWASKAGTPVAGSTYSARHYAEVAASRAAEVDDKLASIADGPVHRVNGQMGDVTLTAADVGAQAAMAMATTQEMQAGSEMAARAMSPALIDEAIKSRAPASSFVATFKYQ